jgi:hypothetical protein
MGSLAAIRLNVLSKQLAGGSEQDVSLLSRQNTAGGAAVRSLPRCDPYIHDTSRFSISAACTRSCDAPSSDNRATAAHMQTGYCCGSCDLLGAANSNLPA